MPITLNHSNIGVQYSTGSNYIIETVKSDLYRRNEIYDNIVRDNLQTAPVTPIINIQDGSNVYAVESYTYSGTANTADFTRVFPKNTTCDILIVGGGGSGSANHGGGGGAGAVVFIKSVVLNSGTYTINVGKGGSSTNFTANDISAIGNKGIDSKILFNSSEILKAEGGGAGGESHTTGNGGSGGSGGGADGYTATTITNNSGAGTVGTSSIFTYNGITGIKYGNVGGNRNTVVADNTGSGGSGGGAGSPGSTPSSPYIGASGGNGVCNAIINSVTYDFSSMFGNSYGVNNDGNNNRYFGGGGGSSYWNRSGYTPSKTSALGGKGGGGDGGFNNGTSSVIAKNGLSNSGGGGGGGNSDGDLNIRNGGAGGSGIVIIRYLLGTIPSNNLLTTQPILNQPLISIERMYPPVRNFTSNKTVVSGQTYGNGIYEISQSASYDGRDGYAAFNPSIIDGPVIGTHNDYVSGVYSGSQNIVSDYTGHWIEIEMPVKINLTRYGFKRRTDILTSAPGQYKIYGSINGTNWTQLVHKTSTISYTSSLFEENVTTIGEYNIFALVVKNLSGTNNILSFNEWYIYGKEYMVFELDGGTHKKLVFDYPKQDDISEMTGMTNWVKIKHKPASWTTIYSGNTFNGSSISGTYTLNSSSDNSKEWAIPFNEPEVKYYLFVMHMSRLNPNYKDLWQVYEASEMKKASTYAGTYGYHANYPYAYKTTMKPLGFAAKNSTNYQGPGYDQFIYNRVYIAGGADPYIDLYNINDDGTWTTDGIALYAEHNLVYRLPAVEGGVYVKYDNDVPFVYPANTSYTLNFPVPTLADINNHSNIVLRGTYNINVNNSNILITPKPVTFINTINNYKIERMYPPVRNFTAATTTVSGQVYGNGTYVVTFSSTYGSGYDPFKCFNTSDIAGGIWVDGRYTEGVFNSTSFIVSGYLGDWLKIQLPVAIKLTRFEFLMRNEGNALYRSRSPKDFKIYGSNDNITWVELVNKTDAVYNASFKYEQTTPEITNAYTYYGLVVNKLLGSTGVLLNFDEWYIYGQELLPSPLSIRYNLLNPILDPAGAQWTYNSSNTNVYHMGSVGIGTTSPEYSLDVRGFIFTSVGGYTQTGSENWVVQSDRRIKENIVKASYEKCLDNVKKIELYNFNFKDNCVNTNDKNQLGFIAQEVQQVYPKAVEVGRMTLDNNQGINDLLTLNTTQIKYTLYGAVKNLIERVENIESRVEQIYNMTLSSNIKSSSSNISITFITPLTPLTSNITTNTSNITINTSNITANTSNITTNSSNISTNTSNITTNTSNITTNTSNRTANTSNITANTSNITANTSNITTNSSNITANTSNITTNSSNTDTSNIDTSNTDTSNIDTSNIDTSNI